MFHSIPSACQSPDTRFHTSLSVISSPCPTLHVLSSPLHLSSSHPTHCYRIVYFNLRALAFERDAPGISLHAPFCLLCVPHCVTHPTYHSCQSALSPHSSCSTCVPHAVLTMLSLLLAVSSRHTVLPRFSLHRNCFLHVTCSVHCALPSTPKSSRFTLCSLSCFI